MHSHPGANYVSMLINNLLRDLEAIGDDRQGFIYMGYSRKVRAIKFGGTGQCPMCRMDQRSKVGGVFTNLRPLGFSFYKDWRLSEQQLLAQLPKPKFGREWFHPGNGLTGWGFRNWVHPIRVNDIRAVQLIHC